MGNVDSAPRRIAGWRPFSVLVGVGVRVRVGVSDQLKP